MKILKLEIKNIRGIPDLTIEPKGKSFVIYGPNGSGKSAVIDSLDFLLTGKIARLSGEGTEGITLKDYGPHIDKVADLSNVEVNAEIEVPGISEAVVISRKMSNPTELKCPDKFKTHLSPIIELLSRGQYVLTRREILKLVTAKSSTRAQQIHQVLKLSDLEDIRANLVTIRNESKTAFETATITLNRNKRNVATNIGKTVYIEAEVLDYVNDQRTKLGGNKIEKLNSSFLQDGITGVPVNPASVNHKTLSELINILKSGSVDLIANEMSEADKKLRSIIDEIKNDAVANWNAKRFVFTKEGLELIRESGECPLCDKSWNKDELVHYLQERIDNESSRQDELSSNSKIISEKAEIIKIRIQQIVDLIKPLAQNESAKTSKVFAAGSEHLNNWSESLSGLLTALEYPLKDYANEAFPKELVNKLYLTEKTDTILAEFEDEVKKLFPEATPEQTAWDNLTRLVEWIKNIEEGTISLEHISIISKRAASVEKAFIEARDEVLDSLYVKIKNRFVGFYKEMHGDDEKGFSADFTPKDAGLNFKVDFYGRGLHPPHAMHSEGHQDSMGVCLFLALSEHLNKGLIDLVILDDVIMSVDIGHRRMFCNVLANNFSDRQFVITTHDTTWANQLKSAGLIPSKQMLKFLNWDIDSGPVVHYEADMWGRIQRDLDNDDVNSAAARLRRGMEEFSRYVCHSLRASVPYTLEDGGDLGDFMPSAIGRYGDLLGKAKEAAHSWKQTEILQELNRVDDQVKKILGRTNVEQWSINKAVHYNQWANLGKQDFIPVVTAFKDLYEKVFSCSNEECQSVLQVTFDGAKVNGVRCKCGAVNWNLTKKL
jgi:energy-coupling factor transporter ATP-binding protein EcfA2